MEAKFFDNGEIFSETLTISTLKISNIDRKEAGSYECVATFFKKEMRLSNFISISS